MAAASESLGPIWPAKLHTLAKHAVLRGYLNAWFPILSKTSQFSTSQILYIDGFAGPGQYTGGEPGSPVIALETAITHVQSFTKPIDFLFVEEDGERIVLLKESLEKIKLKSGNRNLGKIDVRKGDCEVEINALLDGLTSSGKSFGPALAFLDQFGFSAVSMDLIKRILQHDKCEAIIYLDYDGLNRFGGIKDRAARLNQVFGNESWPEVISNGDLARKFYLKSLQKHGAAKFVYAFSMFDKTGKLLYWLIFCTGHWYGMQMMKKSMWTVDKTGNFRFSDKDHADQQSLFETYDDQWLAEILCKRLENQVVSVAEMRDFVLKETPCYLFNDAFKILEVKRKAIHAINPPSSRRLGAFADFEELKFKFLPYVSVNVQSELGF